MSNTDDVYMTRHSARADRERNWKPLPGRSLDDTELSKGGLQASEELAQHLKSEAIPIAHIVSSPFYRCLQTVAPIAKALGLLIKVEPGICEILNVYPPGFWDTETLLQKTNLPIDGGYVPAMTRDQLSQEWGDGEAARRSGQVARTVREHLEGPILFCGHGASCLGIAGAFGGGGYVGYSSLSHYRYDHDKSVWKALVQNDVSHLSPKLKQQSKQSAW